MKKNVVFSAEAVSYQSVANSRFDLAATRLLCPKCNETDKVRSNNLNSKATLQMHECVAMRMLRMIIFLNIVHMIVKYISKSS